MDKQIEGYWYSQTTPQYPMPMPNILTEKEASAIYILIKIKERNAIINEVKSWTISKLTGERLSGIEFETDTWIWPDDFAKHYVFEHKVKPSKEFLKYIGYSDIKIK